MADELIVLPIEKLAGLGDGLGLREGRRVFVPYTLAGDVARVRIVRRTKDAVYGALEEIVTPGPDRIAPACRHFTACGGCSLQHLREAAYRDFKQQMAREAVRKAGFDPAAVEPLACLPASSRRRAELKVENGRIGYYAERSHRLIELEECPVLEPALEALVLRLKPRLAALPWLTGLRINGIDGGYDMLLFSSGREGAPEGWEALPREGIMRIGIQRESGIGILFHSGPATVTLGDVRVELPPGAFLQACREAQARMTRFVLDAAGDARHVLDLFAGVGTYSFPLSAQARVTALEGDAWMVRGMQEAAVRHGLGERFSAGRRDLFRQPVAAEALRAYDAVILNPPRAGAKEQSQALAAALVKKLIMISCSPATFARDARILKEGGYRLVRAQGIDQFVYSSHLEILAEFSS